ncbi:MAG: tetratricopeptide repeat protein, partial [Bacteroidota bacterium]
MKLPRPLAFRTLLLEFFLLFFSFQTSVSITTLEDPDKLLRIAYEHQRAGNFALVKGLCKRILTEFPHYVDARNLYARMLAFETNYVDALSQYDSALVFSARNEDARFGKAQVFGWMGRFKNAMEILQPLTEEQAGNALYATELAKVLAWSGEHLRAYREYERTFILDSKSEEVLRGAARSAKALHRKDVALAWFQRVLAVVPFDREA